MIDNTVTETEREELDAVLNATFDTMQKLREQIASVLAVDDIDLTTELRWDVVGPHIDIDTGLMTGIGTTLRHGSLACPHHTFDLAAYKMTPIDDGTSKWSDDPDLRNED